MTGTKGESLKKPLLRTSLTAFVSRVVLEKKTDLFKIMDYMKVANNGSLEILGGKANYTSNF